ncbi:MAG: envelope stress response membrane protein PspC [Candidatus Hydrogenedentes bacterium]|nr:envelope stress response membrane protein PspC [Candidatus Hydrogenedentota bacterium]
MSDPFGNDSGSWRNKERRARELHREARHQRREERREGRRGTDWRGERREGQIYRSRHGVIFGVCRGMAEYLSFNVFWFRVLVVVTTIFTGLWPIVGLYILAAILLKLEPVVPFEEESEQEFYDSYVNSRSMALARLKRTFDNLERRIRRMENLVTAREYDWERRLNERGS